MLEVPPCFYDTGYTHNIYPFLDRVHMSNYNVIGSFSYYTLSYALLFRPILTTNIFNLDSQETYIINAKFEYVGKYDGDDEAEFVIISY